MTANAPGPPPATDLPERLRRLRATTGWSQEQLARELGVSFATVNRWETGRTAISPRVAPALAAVERRVAEGAADGVGAAPVAHSRFVGRRAELAELVALLGANRLVCLTGPGGAGKTRLALEALRGDPTGPVTFVPLAAARDTATLRDTVAVALQVRPTGAAPTLETVVAHLGAHPRVLLLDGAEHVRDEVAAFVDHVLGATGGTRVVVTTRRVLGVAGEISWAVPPLACPTPGASGPQTAQSDAVALFVARAAERLPGFAADVRTLELVGELCRRLDGLPLAIELIAGWVGTLSVAEILDRRADLLGPSEADGGATGTERTLGAVLEGSWALLGPPEREVLCSLATFAGTFGVDDAAAVAGVDDAALPRQLRTLVDSSWLTVRTGDGASRFAMLGTIRSFAAARLADAGSGEAARRRHAAHFADLARRSEAGLTGPDSSAWTVRLADAAADLETALWWAERTGAKALGVGMCADLWRWWLMSGRLSIGRGWLQVFLGDPGDAGAATVARARSGAAVLAAENGDYREAAGQAAAALSLFETAGDDEAAAFASTVLGSAYRYLGERDAARANFERAMALREALGDERGMAVGLNNLALVALDGDDLEGARDLFERSLVRKRRLGDPRTIAVGLANLSDVLIRTGRLTVAATCLDEAVGLAADVGDRQLGGTLQCNLGDLALRQGRPEEAAERFATAVVAYREAGHTHDVVVALTGLGRVLVDLGRREDGLKALREAETLATEAGHAPGVADVRAALAAAGESSLAPLPDGLTARQAEILARVAAGRSNKEIAAELYLSVATVERHLANLYRKLGLRGRVEATRYAVTHGLAGAAP